MKIGLFYVWNVLGGWGSCGGYARSLARMGHEVLEYSFPGNLVSNPEAHVKKAPSLEQLNSCDAILSLHHEYTQPWLSAVYDYEKVWKKIKTPIVARLDESVDRFDLQIERRLDELKQWCSMLTYPAAQDAEKQKAPWVPHSVDATMFTSFADGVKFDKYGELEKKYDVAFIGSLYGTRQRYLQYLAEALGDKVATLNVGQVFAQDLSGTLGEETMELLASNYRQIKLFFCLPPLSRLIVTKVFEAMACGTFVMCPRFPGEAAKNCLLFKDGEEVAYYDIGQFVDNAKQIVEWLYENKERTRVAKAGCKKVRGNHTYEMMFDNLLNLAVTARDVKPIAGSTKLEVVR